MTGPQPVRLPPLAGGQHLAWLALVELAPLLGESWALVGGQMVFLHEVERGSSDTRPTDDLDLVLDLRVEPTALARTHEALSTAGFEQFTPNADGVAHRYARSGAVIDVLAPDNLGARANLRLGGGRTISAPGTSQALARCEVLRVELDDGRTVGVRRPTLVGAVLGKVAAATQIVSQPRASVAKHRRDVDALARLLGAADRRDAKLTSKERSLLGRVATNEWVELSELGRRSLALLANRET